MYCDSSACAAPGTAAVPPVGGGLSTRPQVYLRVRRCAAGGLEWERKKSFELEIRR